jgi:ketosteroid isomerase-like protein
MSGTNVDLVRGFLERFNNEDPEQAVEVLAEDFVAVVPPALSAEPDVYEGREGALRYMRGFEGMLEDVRFEPVEFHEEGEQVIVEMLLVGRGVTSGIDVEQRVALIVWVEDGKVARMEPTPDLESARKRLRSA